MHFDITTIINNVIVPILVTIIINYSIKSFEAYKQHKDYLAKKREEQYLKLLNFLYRSITESNNINLSKELFEISLNLPLWANKEIIAGFNNFRQNAVNIKSEEEKIKTEKLLADLINLIRKDLGSKKIDSNLIINEIFPKNGKENPIEK